MGGPQKLFKSLGLVKVKTVSDGTVQQKKPKKAKGRKWKFWRSSVHAADDKQEVAPRKPDYPRGSQDWAAVVIQTAFRGFMARRTLRAIKGLVRLQALVRGRTVRKQASITLRCMQTLVKVQRARQTRLTEASAIRAITQRQIPTDKAQDSEKGWSDSVWTKEEIRTRIQQKHEAAVKRERALAYAFSHQWRAHPRPPSKGSENPEWEWGWLERWMAARPWESHAVEEALRNGVHPSQAVKSPHNGIKEIEFVDSPKSVQSNSKFHPTPGSDRSSPLSSSRLPSDRAKLTGESKPTTNSIEKPAVKSRYMTPKKLPGGGGGDTKPRSASLPKQRPTTTTTTTTTTGKEAAESKKRLSLPTPPKIKTAVTPTTKSPVITPKKV